MKPVYITAPLIIGIITTIECKAPHYKRAKRKQVPLDYRKNRFVKLCNQLFYIKQDIKRIFRKENHYGK